MSDVHQHNPLVSVVLPFMNEEQFLGEAIDSVLEQSYSNWELLLIDDGSTNNSTLVAKEYAAKYPEKIIYLEHEGHVNRGATVSRNLGVQKAKGEFIALLDADDLWLPEKLANQIDIFLANPVVDMVAEGSIHWYNWCNPERRNIPIPVGAVPEQVYAPNDLLLHLYPLSTGAAPGPSALMIRKDTLIQVGGFEEAFIKQYQLYEDQAFLCKIYLNSYVYISSAYNNLYRQRPDSTVSSVKQKGQYHAVRRFFLEWLSDYIRSHGVKNKAIDRLLANALYPYDSPTAYMLTHTLPLEVIRLSKLAVPGPLKNLIKKQLHLVK